MSHAGRGRAKLPVFVFDFGGVMIKWKSNDPIYDFIADRYGVPRAGMRRQLESELPRLECGEITTTEFLAEGLRRFGARLRRGDTPEVLWTQPFARLVRPRKGAIALVRSLRRRGYRVFLFSNTSFPHARYLRKAGWGELFDGILTSCELRCNKPSPEAFRRALEEIGAAPSEAAFIDDKEANVRGAKEAGLRWAIRFTTVGGLSRDLAGIASSSSAR